MVHQRNYPEDKTVVESITVLADKGYHNGEKLHRFEEVNKVKRKAALWAAFQNET